MTDAEHEAAFAEKFKPGKAAYVAFDNAYISALFAENLVYLGLHGEVAGVVGSADHGGCYTGVFEGGIDERRVVGMPKIVGWRPPT